MAARENGSEKQMELGCFLSHTLFKIFARIDYADALEKHDGKV